MQRTFNMELNVVSRTPYPNRVLARKYHLHQCLGPKTLLFGPLSKLLVFPLITPIVDPYVISYVSPFKESRL